MKRQAGIFIFLFLKKEYHPHDKLIQMHSHSFRFGENKTVISCGKILPSKLDLTGHLVREVFILHSVPATYSDAGDIEYLNRGRQQTYPTAKEWYLLNLPLI